MEVKVLVFGACRDIVRSSELNVKLPEGATVMDFRKILSDRYPDILKLKSLMVAINNAYAQNDQVVRQSDEIALIPPVSGG